MSARTAFWNCYLEMIYRNYYLIEYKLEVDRIDKLLTWFVAIASSAFVAALVIWERFPLLWMLVTIAVQVVGVIRPSFNFAKIEYAINLALPDVQRITVEMEREWIFIDTEPENDIAKSKLKYTERYYAIDNKYLLALNLKPNKKLIERAMNSRDSYVFAHFNTQQQEVTV